MYKDPLKQKAFQQVHYQNNKALFRQRSKQRRIENKQLVICHKISNPCCQCGESDVVCLDLHHINPSIKDDNIAEGIRNWGQTRLKKELLKCVVMCSNCHRKYHAKDISVTTKNVMRLRNRKLVHDYKLAHPCKCGETEFCCLEFHHRNRAEKEIGISSAVYFCGLRKLEAEIKKCDVLCGNCHRKLHRDELLGISLVGETLALEARGARFNSVIPN